MIHQLIFASPKPGMSEEEFQRYWVEVHAVKYASKIPQIKRYMIGTTIHFSYTGGGNAKDPQFGGCAEIWLKDEKEQLESLQSKEFLEGARLDEPKWAAFWRTLVLDTDSHILMEGGPLTKNPTWIKFMVLIKRKPGMLLEDFRNYSLNVHGPIVKKLPGIRRYLQCHVRDSWYEMGEPRFDLVAQIYFDDADAFRKAMASSISEKETVPDAPNFMDMKNIFAFTVKEHWIIGPEFRK